MATPPEAAPAALMPFRLSSVVVPGNPSMTGMARPVLDPMRCPSTWQKTFRFAQGLRELGNVEQMFAAPARIGVQGPQTGPARPARRRHRENLRICSCARRRLNCSRRPRLIPSRRYDRRTPARREVDRVRRSIPCGSRVGCRGLLDRGLSCSATGSVPSRRDGSARLTVMVFVQAGISKVMPRSTK